MTWRTAARVLSRGPLNSCKLGPGKETPTLALPFPLTQTPTLWLGFCPPCSPATHSQRPQAIQAPEHAAPNGLQLVGGQVQLAH